MNFLNLWAVGFAAIAPVIVALYLLKLKRRTVPVSTLLFWQRVVQESRRRAFFQKLRQLFSLLLHLLIFLLILGALLRPTFDRLVRDGTSTVLILDTRARMQAIEPSGETRFEKARKMALELASHASPLRQIALLSLDAAPAVLTPFSDDEKTLRQALVQLQPSDAAGTLEPAIQLARELLGSRNGARQILVFTDRPAPASAVAAPSSSKIAPSSSIVSSNSPAQSSSVEVSFVSVGTARENVAITRFAARPLLSSPQTSEVLLEVANFGTKPIKTNVELSLDGRLVDVKPLSLSPGERRTQVFPTVSQPGAHSRGWLAARLESMDSLPLDNVAYAVLPVDPPQRILLVSSGNYFLERLFAADQSIAFELLTPDAFQPALAEKFDAVVFDNLASPKTDFTRLSGNLLYLAQTPFGDGGAELAQPLISETDTTHPAVRLANLQNVTLLKAASLALPKTPDWNWQAPIRSFEHPLLITGEQRAPQPVDPGAPSAPLSAAPIPPGPRRLAALAFALTDSDLPLRVAFPLLMTNTVHWLAGEKSAAPANSLAGETIVLSPSEKLIDDVQFPSVTTKKVDDLAHRITDSFTPLRDGYYRIERAEGNRWLAANTFSDAESDLRLAPAVDSSSALPALPTMLTWTAFSAWPLWQILAAAALLLFSFEWWLFHRRRTE